MIGACAVQFVSAAVPSIVLLLCMSGRGQGA